MACVNRLRQLAVACTMYLDAVGGHRFFPKTLSELYTSKIVGEPTLFVCPNDRNPVRTADGLLVSYESIFDLAPVQLTDVLPPTTPMIWDKQGNHPNGRHVCFADTHVKFVAEEEFQKMMAQLKASDDLKKGRPK